MRYIKHKREKSGECTICRQTRDLSWDHIPPQAAGNIDPVILVSAMTALTGDAQGNRSVISQNGYKIRSICKACNETIGHEYDPTIGELCANITRYLESPLTLPSEANFDTVPARLLRGLLAHMLSAKLFPTAGVVDQHIREYLADHTLSFNSDWHLYYWFYPHPPISVLRDFAMMIPTRSGREVGFCSVMKFPPLGMLLTDAKYFHDLPDLCIFSHFGIDDPGRIQMKFKNPYPSAWPEGPDHSGFIVAGDSAANSLYSTPRAPAH
jgi:hypothetical protein